VRRRTSARAAFAVALLVNLVALYYPRHVAQGGVPYVDKVVHVAVFAAVAWTGVRAGLPVRWLAGLLVLHAVSSELIQHFLLPARSGDPADAVADVLGVGLGVGLGLALGVARGPDGGSLSHDGAGGRDRPDRAAAGRDADPG
jgi:hypothetical protein